MTPFYESPSVTIYNARWEDVWPTLGLAPKDVALCWADPPYGVSAVQKRHGRRAGDESANRGTRVREWRPIVGDAAPFDPRSLLVFQRLIAWGGNHYADRLPAVPSWWVWHKRPGMADGVDFADGEAAWTNLGGQLRVFAHAWMGVCTETEAGRERLHPTQKPVALCEWGFERAGLKPGDLVFSPYLGSGPEVRAALNMGLRIIGCEVDAAYCQTVVDHRVALAAPKRGQEGQALLPL